MKINNLHNLDTILKSTFNNNTVNEIIIIKKIEKENKPKKETFELSIHRLYSYLEQTKNISNLKNIKNSNCICSNNSK